MSDDNIVPFPLRAGAELELVARLKALTYEYAGRVTIAQVMGCFQIALEEIKDSQP